MVLMTAGGVLMIVALLSQTSLQFYIIYYIFSVDEVPVSGPSLSVVQFTQFVPFYVENYLGFPVGTGVPVGKIFHQENIDRQSQTAM